MLGDTGLSDHIFACFIVVMIAVWGVSEWARAVPEPSADTVRVMLMDETQRESGSLSLPE